MKKFISFFILIALNLVLSHAAYLVDDAENGTNINILGGTWGTYTDGYSTAVFTPNAMPGQSGAYCRGLSWTINKGAPTLYAGALTSLNASWSGVNLSAYKGIRFYAKGYGLYEITLATAQTQSENNHYAKKLHVTNEWTLYELPFLQFAQTWGTPKPWDPTTIYSVGLTVISGAGISGQLYIDNIEFYSASEAHPVPNPNVKIYEPKVNQEGYPLGEKKYFIITADSVSSGDAFQILNASGNPVYNGVISGTPTNDTASTGEFVWKVDFTSFNTPGSYRVKVKNRLSYTFNITDSIYNKLFRDALRCFYLIRCGLAENDPVSALTDLRAIQRHP